MFEQLQALDRQLLVLINSANTQFLDNVMWIISGKLTWIPLYALLLYFLIRKVGRNWWLLLLAIALTVLLADSISVHCFKNVVQRYRPTHNLLIGNMLHIVHGYHGGMYGFVSSHAANTFAIVVFTSLIMRNRWFSVLMTLWAAIVCYSRMYIGAHYPADIACGALLGAACGFAVYKLYIWCADKLENKHQCNE